MQYSEYVQKVEHIANLIKDVHYAQAVDALYQLILSDISDVDKADLCANLAGVYDHMGNANEALAWYEKGIAYEQDFCRYTASEKKAQYLSQMGRSDQAVPIYEFLLKQPYVSEGEKDRMRRTLQSFLSKTMRNWQ